MSVSQDKGLAEWQASDYSGVDKYFRVFVTEQATMTSRDKIGGTIG